MSLIYNKNTIKHRVCKENHVRNPSKCTCEIDRYLKSIVDDLVITFDEVIDAPNNKK